MSDAAEIIARLTSHPLAIAFLIMTLALLTGAGALAWRGLRLAKGGRAQATVIDYHERTDSQTGSVSYAPIFRYRIAGVERTKQSVTGYRKTRGPTGEAIAIRYDPEKPERAEVATGDRGWLAVLTLLVLAGGTLAAAWRLTG